MENLFEAFIALFVIMDPLGNLPLFISFTKGMPLSEIKKNINKAVFVAAMILFLFLFLGLDIFDFFGINLDSFQIAGGIVLLITAILYVFGLQYKLLRPHGNDLSVPIGTPLLTGPGTITTTIILVKQNGALVTVIAAFLALAATWVIFMNYSKLYKILGEHWTGVISRVMGIILAAIAVEFIVKGVLNIISPLYN